MQSRVLTCPRDGTPLVTEDVYGVAADRCGQCRGLWLDEPELGELESVRAHEDARRGMVDYAQRPSELACPVCGQPMTAFNYRAHNLELERCEEHGYWLDAGEDRRVLDIVQERARSLGRVSSAEAAWQEARRGGGRTGGGFLGGIRRRLGL